MLQERTRAALTVYDVDGRHVRTLVDDVLDNGLNETAWDGGDALGNAVGSCAYLCRLGMGNQAIAKKSAILR